MTTWNKLTAVKIKKLKERGSYHDGGGLYLYVSKGGAKHWVYRFMLNKRRREMGLGSLDDFSIAEAREQRDTQRKLTKQGIDPIEHRKAQRAAQLLEDAKAERERITFQQCAEACIKAKTPEWKNAKHAQQWTNTLTTYAFPIIGQLPVASVDQAAVLTCLKPIWTTKTETATRVRQRIETVLNYGKAKGYREGDNPAAWKGGLEPVLPKPNKLKNVQHHEALPYDKLPAFMSQLKAQAGQGAQALRFTILTAARTGEVIGAQWQEIDFEKRLWIIPKERMKAGYEHRIALSKAAIGLLKNLPRISEHIFPGQKQGKHISNVTMLKTLERMKRDDLTVHGFRSTFRDWIAEKTNYPARMAETALAHQLKDETERAYQRGDLLEKRAAMMEAWARYCDIHKGKIVKLHA